MTLSEADIGFLIVWAIDFLNLHESRGAFISISSCMTQPFENHQAEIHWDDIIAVDHDESEGRRSWIAVRL